MSVPDINTNELTQLMNRFDALTKNGKSGLEDPSRFSSVELEQAFTDSTRDELKLISLPMRLLGTLLVQSSLSNPTDEAMKEFVDGFPETEELNQAIKSYQRKCAMTIDSLSSNEEFVNLVRWGSASLDEGSDIRTLHNEMIRRWDDFRANLEEKSRVMADDKADTWTGAVDLDPLFLRLNI